MRVNSRSAGLAIWVNTLCDLVSIMVEHGMVVLVIGAILLGLMGVGELNVLARRTCCSTTIFPTSAKHVTFWAPMALCLWRIREAREQYCV